MKFSNLAMTVRVPPIKKLLFIATISFGIALLYPAFLVFALLGKRKDPLLSNHAVAQFTSVQLKKNLIPLRPWGTAEKNYFKELH